MGVSRLPYSRYHFSYFSTHKTTDGHCHTC